MKETGLEGPAPVQEKVSGETGNGKNMVLNEEGRGRETPT